MQLKVILGLEERMQVQRSLIEVEAGLAQWLVEKERAEERLEKLQLGQSPEQAQATRKGGSDRVRGAFARHRAANRRQKRSGLW